ncbi:MAG: beta-propeller fold lactonase family protein, partial [Candidatus Krumholzibacteriia bacterium]
EGDKARRVAVTSDGNTAVVIHNHSQNAAIIDVPSQSIQAVVSLGERPGEVRITHDDTRAVVSNLNDSFCSIIDIASASVTEVTISRRAGHVAISPNDHYAYLAVVASGDGVWRVDLNTLSVDGPKILTGSMGGIGFGFDQVSGMTLSHDGATLVTCNSYDNNISIIDTASWAELVRVPVGSFPVRAAFSPDDSRIYVSNRDADSITIVDNAGAASTAIASVSVGAFPFELTTNVAGTKLYVANYNGKSISVVDIPANTVSNTIALPQPGGAGQPMSIAVAGDDTALYVAANGADVHRIDTATEMITHTLNTGIAPAQLVFNDATQCAYVASPLGADGLSVVCLFDSCATDVADGTEQSGNALELTSLPNPFERGATISFRLRRPAEHLRLDVYDVTGRRVARILDGPRSAGQHSVPWEARRLPGGVYWLRCEVDGEVSTARISCVR